MGYPGIHVSSGTSYVTNPINPNPGVFRIVEIYRFGSLWAAKVNYPNCTNYEGDKILVMNRTPRGLHTIDPHFTKGGDIVARFEPTERGWQMAKDFVDTYGRK